MNLIFSKNLKVLPDQIFSSKTTWRNWSKEYDLFRCIRSIKNIEAAQTLYKKFLTICKRNANLSKNSFEKMLQKA